MRNVSKTFPGTRALDEVSLEIAPGEIRGLAGQNGSGKSTLVKVLSGFVHPDRGSSIEVNGEVASLPLNAGEAGRLGLCFLHQDLGLVETMSVVENLSVRSLRTGHLGRIRWKAERERARRELEAVGLDIDPTTLVRDLAPAERALVGLARALRAASGRTQRHVLLLDEPTAYLSQAEVLRLLAVMRGLADDGNAVLFVSHRLPEILETCDSVSVLRDGRLVATEPVTAELTHTRMMRLMFGDAALKDRDEVERRATTKREETALRVTGLTGRRVSNIDLSVSAGEIVGVTGLAGMGQDELPYLILGSRPKARGEIEVGGVPITSVMTALRAGTALVPADRLAEGIVPAASAAENITMRGLSRLFRRGWLSHRDVRSTATTLMERFDVRPLLPSRRMSSFSGGNQQKALLARWLETRPHLLLLHEPTGGVDILSKERILAIVAETAAAGCGVLVCSAEYGDLADLCDRVVVLYDGTVMTELKGDALSEQRLAAECHRSGDRERAGAGRNYQDLVTANAEEEDASSRS